MQLARALLNTAKFPLGCGPSWSIRLVTVKRHIDRCVHVASASLVISECARQSVLKIFASFDFALPDDNNLPAHFLKGLDISTVTFYVPHELR